MSSIILWNEKGIFRKEVLPVEAQFAPLRGIVVTDLNHDGRKDILAAGNMYGAEVETVRYDAGIGVCLLQGPNGFTARSSRLSGFYVPGDVRDLKLIEVSGRPVVLVANNSGKMQAFVIR